MYKFYRNEIVKNEETGKFNISVSSNPNDVLLKNDEDRLSLYRSSTEGNIEQLANLLTYLPDSERDEIREQYRNVVAEDNKYFNALLKEEKELADTLNSSGSGCSVVILIGIGTTLLAMSLL